MLQISRRSLGRIALTLPMAGSVFGGGRAHAASTVKIGAIYPLSGNAGSAGQALQKAIEVGANIVNNAHPDLAALPLGPSAGLPGLGGAKVQVTFADQQGNPAVAQSDALRLITQDRVAALVGCYQSSCTLTASAVAERYGIPFVAGESSAPNLTERGFKWFFRTTPIGSDFGKAYGEFLSGLAKQGHPVHSVAMVNENTDYGSSTGDAIAGGLKQYGLSLALRIPYNANSTDLSAEVLQLKQANPDAVIFVSYTSDSILYMKTMHTLAYKPAVVIGDDSGFSDPAFVKSVGDLAQGAVNRSSFDAGKQGSTSWIVNEMYRKAAGHGLDDTSARGLNGFLVLCDAINRAGSTQPAKIQAALRTTDLKADQIMIGYDGVKFGPNGQNQLASTLLVQLRGTGWDVVWPEAKATAKAELPFKG
jgi:branched-chain amino acid transport system substrate-binding protein